MYINLILVHIEKKTKLLYYVTIADQLDNALTYKNYILEEEKLWVCFTEELLKAVG